MKTQTQYRGIEHTPLSDHAKCHLDQIVDSLKGRTIVNVVFSDAAGPVTATLLLDNENYLDICAPALGLDLLDEDKGGSQGEKGTASDEAGGQP